MNVFCCMQILYIIPPPKSPWENRSKLGVGGVNNRSKISEYMTDLYKSYVIILISRILRRFFHKMTVQNDSITLISWLISLNNPVCSSWNSYMKTGIITGFYLTNSRNNPINQAFLPVFTECCSILYA